MRRKQQPKRIQRRTRRLRKQPKMRRVQSATAVPIPTINVPKTAAQRRRRNQRRRRWRLPAVAINQVIFSSRWVSLGLLSLTVYALILSGLHLDFYLTLIPVEGTQSLPASEIVAASGLAGAHIFAADPNDAAARITELPGVISATVTLGWPNEVLVQVKEDSPVAIWEEGAFRYWITQHGRLIPSRTDALDLLVITSEMAAAPAALMEEAEAETAEAADESIPEAGIGFVPLEILRGALQLRQLRPDVTHLYYRPSGGLSYEDERGWRVYFGTGTDMHQKLVVYETMVTELLARDLTPEYISVSNQEKPYYMAR